ncbi:MAG: hypothetical protein IKG58_04490 [Bacilli bacterium]|nr:hypothetical protein [Bacilli bacterium]
MFKKVYDKIKNFIIEEYKYILLYLVLFIVFSWPVNYNIITGGGISNIDSRITINNKYKSKGSFNITYVNELKGNVFNYLLSYIIPDWDRENMNDYKYNNEENYYDILYRSKLELDYANDNAIKTAYTLANKEYKVISKKIYVTGTFKEYKTKLKSGDQILEIDNNKFNTLKQVRKYINSTNNKYVNIKIKRNKKEKIIKSKIYKYKYNKLIGIAIQEVSKYKTNPKVKIKFKDSESGPSAGLITTLEIYNELTKKDITHSLKIAGTGTIESDGKVGEIGGIKYKLLGAEKAKADIFLAPSGKNYKTCIKLKKKRKLKIKIIEVKNIKQAIRELNKIKP